MINNFSPKPSVTKEDFERELEDWGAYVAEMCDGCCETCGLYQPLKEITCRGTECARELQIKIEEISK